jgi:hypothetical protein
MKRLTGFAIGTLFAFGIVIGSVTAFHAPTPHSVNASQLEAAQTAAQLAEAGPKSIK